MKSPKMPPDRPSASRRRAEWMAVSTIAGVALIILVIGLWLMPHGGMIGIVGWVMVGYGVAQLLQAGRMAWQFHNRGGL